MKVKLELADVYKSFGDFTIRNVNLQVLEGEYFVVLGPSGAGKTLLLQVIAGIYRPDRGRIIIDSADVTNTPPEKRNVGYVPQNYALFPHLNVRENIEYGLKVRRLDSGEIEKRVREVADKLGIRHLLGRDVKTLSGGEAQRVALARALVIQPRLLLLDEPLAAVDPVLRWELRDFLKSIREKFNTTVIHVTHDFSEALALADRIAVMNKGEIVQVGPPHEIFYEPKSEFVAWFTRAGNVFKGYAEPKGPGVSVVSLGPFDIVVKGNYKGPVTVMFRPEYAVVAREKLESSARNEIEGVIKDYVDEGALVLLKVSCGGVTVKAYVTKVSFQELGLKPGEKVYLYVKASQVHVIR